MNLAERIEYSKTAYASIKAGERSVTIDRDGGESMVIAAVHDARWTMNGRMYEPWLSIARNAVELCEPSASADTVRDAIVFAFADKGLLWKIGQRVVDRGVRKRGTGTVVRVRAAIPAVYVVLFDGSGSEGVAFGDELAPCN